MAQQHRSGPVRSEHARKAILQATAELFGELGYERLTIEGIAARSGTGKRTIYRWWGSKGDLIADCLLEGLLLPEAFVIPNTGNIHADFGGWLQGIFSLLNDEQGEFLMRAIIAAAAQHPEVGLKLRQKLIGDSTVTIRLRQAIESGELPPELPLTEITEALIGAVILQALSRQISTAEQVQRLLEAVIGVAHH